jgi:hypothetical protein
MTVFFPDAEERNRDWPKRSWDFPDVRNVRQLRRWLRDNGVSAAEFKRSPAYRMALDDRPWLRKL